MVWMMQRSVLLKVCDLFSIPDSPSVSGNVIQNEPNSGSPSIRYEVTFLVLCCQCCCNSKNEKWRAYMWYALDCLTEKSWISSCAVVTPKSKDASEPSGITADKDSKLVFWKKKQKATLLAKTLFGTLFIQALHSPIGSCRHILLKSRLLLGQKLDCKCDMHHVLPPRWQQYQQTLQSA